MGGRVVQTAGRAVFFIVRRRPSLRTPACPIRSVAGRSDVCIRPCFPAVLLKKVRHCEEERRSNLRLYSKVAAVARRSLAMTEMYMTYPSSNLTHPTPAYLAGRLSYSKRGVFTLILLKIFKSFSFLRRTCLPVDRGADEILNIEMFFNKIAFLFVTLDRIF